MTDLDDFAGDDLLDADGNVIPCTTPMLGTCDTHCQHWFDGSGLCCWCSDDPLHGDETDSMACPALVEDDEVPA